MKLWSDTYIIPFSGIESETKALYEACFLFDNDLNVLLAFGSLI